MAMTAAERKRKSRKKLLEEKGLFEKTYNATKKEHEKLKEYLAEIRLKEES